MAKRLILFLLLFLISDIYFYQAVVTLFSGSSIPIFYWFVDVLIIVSIVSIIFLRQRISDIQRIASILITAMLLVFIPKLFSFPILFIEDIGRLFRGFPARSVYVSEIVVFIAVAIFLAIVFGLTRGRHRCSVH